MEQTADKCPNKMDFPMGIRFCRWDHEKVKVDAEEKQACIVI
jgi:hypothetical protein